MSERFFVDRPIAAAATITLVGDEGRHLAMVMRAHPGDEVTLFDGSGAEFAARVVRVRKHELDLEIVERREISRELLFDLTLAVALPKGDRQKWLVEKLTELGVTRLVPLITERGVAQPVASALERLRRGVIEASKQCGRNRLMEVTQPLTVEQLLASANAEAPRILADPSGTPFTDIPVQRGRDCSAAIGPEGGFAPRETAAANEAGWQVVSLGPCILRVETAALAIAARLRL